MKIKTIEDLDNIFLERYKATLSSVEEVNTFEHYSLVGDTEHDYSLLKRVYKILYKGNDANPYNEIFILVFSKNGGIYDVKGLGESPEEVEKVWENIEWEEDCFKII